MAQPPPPQARRAAAQQPEAVEEAPKTHVLARSRNARGFNRAGFRWYADYQAVPLAEIAAKAEAMTEANQTGRPTRTEDLVKSILTEPALDARLISAEEAKAYEDQRRAVASEDISPTELYQAFIAQGLRLRDVEKKLEELLAQKYAAVGDLPPKLGELPAGSMPNQRA